MSAVLFFSSDYPLEEIKNPHYRTFSVNEALAFGVELPSFVLESETIDRDKPKTILWSALDMEKAIDPITRKVVDNGIEDDFSIRIVNDFTDMYTAKKYQAALEWDVYSEKRAKHIVEYIRRHMEFTNELEIWHVWLSDHEVPIVHKVSINLSDVTAETLREIDEADFLGDPLPCYCWVIQKKNNG